MNCVSDDKKLAKDGKYHYEWSIERGWRIYIGDITVDFASSRDEAELLCVSYNRDPELGRMAQKVTANKSAIKFRLWKGDSE